LADKDLRHILSGDDCEFQRIQRALVHHILLVLTPVVEGNSDYYMRLNTSPGTLLELEACELEDDDDVSTPIAL
jgi:hypothetical protein